MTRKEEQILRSLKDEALESFYKAYAKGEADYNSEKFYKALAICQVWDAFNNVNNEVGA